MVHKYVKTTVVIAILCLKNNVLQSIVCVKFVINTRLASHATCYSLIPSKYLVRIHLLYNEKKKKTSNQKQLQKRGGGGGGGGGGRRFQATTLRPFLLYEMGALETHDHNNHWTHLSPFSLTFAITVKDLHLRPRNKFPINPSTGGNNSTLESQRQLHKIKQRTHRTKFHAANDNKIQSTKCIL